MGALASQITNLTIVYSKHQSSETLAICAGNSPVSGEFPTQMASYYAEDISIWWRHHEEVSKQVSCRGVLSGNENHVNWEVAVEIYPP